MPGLTIATLIEMCQLKQTQEPEFILFQVPLKLELIAKVSLREDLKVLLRWNLMIIKVVMMPGLTIATLIEMWLPKLMVVLESMHLQPLESELNAKDSLRSKNQVWLNYSKHIRVILMLGLMTVILTEMFQLQQTHPVLEHGKLDKMDHSQELVSIAKDSPRSQVPTTRNIESTTTID